MTAILRRRLQEASGLLGRFAVCCDAILDMPFTGLAAHWDLLRQDLRYIARTLARSPGFTATAILVVAIGVGANTAAFSLADFVLIRPLPFTEPERLVHLWERLPGYDEMELSPANYRDWKQMGTAFESMGAYCPIAVNMVGQSDPERLAAATVTPDLFPTLGVQPMLGRMFSPPDAVSGANATVLLSYRLWKSVFGADPAILGRTVTLDNAACTVIGVMPADFIFPSRDVELWTPKVFRDGDFKDRNDNYLHVVARLKPGVSLAQAQAHMELVARDLERQYPGENTHHGAAVILLRNEVSRQSRMLLIALCGAALCVLLISSANLASLLLARALARQRELAIRSALGAGRERLVRQMITESLVLSGLGGSLGLVVALTALPLLTRLVPNALPIAQQPALDLRVLIVAGVLTTLTGLAFGLAPALRICRGSDLSGLREGAREGGGSKERLRSALVVAEITASAVLLISAGLLIRALWKVQAADPGFNPQGVLTLTTALPFPKYDKTALRERFYTDVLSEARQLPAVSDAAYIGGLPMVWRGGIWPVAAAGEIQDRSESHTASLRFVTPGFFAALSIPLHTGRDISEGDTADGAWVALVSESFVRRHWPGQDPLDRHFQFAFHDRKVIGVVGDVRVRGMETSSEPQVYVSYKQALDGQLTYYAPQDLVIKSSAPPESLLPAIRRIIRRADPDQPISDVRTMAEIVDQDTASRSVQVRVLGAFASIAFLLAAVGIHGLLSFAVSQRSREIGVRIALGAGSRDILVMVLRRAALLAVAGVLPGLGLAYLSGRMMQALLAGITPADPATFAAAAALCIIMTVLGALSPAIRAVRIDPISAIRTE
jgi:putative ABC transport system permease protein